MCGCVYECAVCVCVLQVGDILTGLGGEDDEELLDSLTAEIGDQFNILEYADPELAALNDTEHILDGLELADDAVAPHDRHDRHDRHLKRDNQYLHLFLTTTSFHYKQDFMYAF